MFVVTNAEVHALGMHPTYSQQHMPYFRRKLTLELAALGNK
jgi:hypothetical protein